MNEAQWATLGSEHGFFERVSAITFAIVGAFAFIIFAFRRYSLWLYFSLLMAMASMREMDLHKAWTSDSILKSRFYLDSGVPIEEKLIGAGVILLLIFIAVQMTRHIPFWLRSLWNFRARAWTIGFALGSLAVAKLLDSMARVIPPLAEFHAENRAFLTVIEESLEMAGALFFLTLCLMAIRTSR